MGGLGKHISQRDREYFEEHSEWYPKSEDKNMLGKKHILAKAITKFKNSKQTKASYMNLFIAVHDSLRQGSGLIWPEIDKILKDVLNK